MPSPAVLTAPATIDTLVLPPPPPLPAPRTGIWATMHTAEERSAYARSLRARVKPENVSRLGRPKPKPVWNASGADKAVYAFADIIRATAPQGLREALSAVLLGASASSVIEVLRVTKP
jgi:hypothetical protein